MRYTVKSFLLKELFPDDFTFDKLENLGDVVDVKHVTEPYVLILYRGFNADLSSLERENGSYVLSPKKSEQGMIWFTHQFIRTYNPVEYAKNHGSLLLTYPLKVKKHYDLVTYSTGKQVKRSPEELQRSVDETENQPFLCMYNEFCLELPVGWVFTYKHEKFIGTTNKLLVSPDMIEPVSED